MVYVRGQWSALLEYIRRYNRSVGIYLLRGCAPPPPRPPVPPCGPPSHHPPPLPWTTGHYVSDGSTHVFLP